MFTKTVFAWGRKNCTFEKNVLKAWNRRHYSLPSGPAINLGSISSHLTRYSLLCMEKTEKLAQVVRYTYYPAVWNVDLCAHWKTMFCHRVLTLLFCWVAILWASPCTCAVSARSSQKTHIYIHKLRMSIGFFPKIPLYANIIHIDGLHREWQYWAILLTTLNYVSNNTWFNHVVKQLSKKLKKCQFGQCLYTHMPRLLRAERNAHHL